MEFSQKNDELDPDSYENKQLSTIHQIPSSEIRYDIVFRNVVFDFQSSLGKIS